MTNVTNDIGSSPKVMSVQAGIYCADSLTFSHLFYLASANPVTSNISIGPGPTVVAGQNYTFSIIAKDAFGNNITSGSVDASYGRSGVPDFLPDCIATPSNGNLALSCNTTTAGKYLLQFT